MHPIEKVDGKFSSDYVERSKRSQLWTHRSFLMQLNDPVDLPLKNQIKLLRNKNENMIRLALVPGLFARRSA